jgi:hypothetical protein
MSLRNALRLVALLAVSLAGGTVLAQQPDINGTWQGKMAIDANTSLTIQFVFSKRPDGSYGALLNSPDNGAIKNVAASAVTYGGGMLNVQVASLSGSYAGSLKDGKFDGRWTQQGSTLPLVLAPYTKPVIAKAGRDLLTGSWGGPMNIPGIGPLTLIVRFKEEKGELGGTIAVQEQGGQETPVSDLELNGDKVTFRVPRGGAEFTGTVANGVIDGNWKQPQPMFQPNGLKVALRKGEFKPPVYPLKLTNEQYVKLSGRWQGKMAVPQAPNGSLTVIFRIETNESNQYVGYTDSPDQGGRGIPMAEAMLEGDKVTFKVPVLRAEYTGTLAGKTINGTLTQGGQPRELNLAKQ